MVDETQLDLDQQHQIKRRYRQQKRRFMPLIWLWLLTGLLGGHRYYLKQYRSGVAMTLGLFVALSVGWFTWYLLVAINLGWWLYDGFHLKRWLVLTNAQIRQQILRQVVPPSMTPTNKEANNG
ncbi:hypothetical protein JCM14202_1446 [Agrilactobacillus composti DSM 18527 = JCM 14202]|nr:hypothetical protein JCM14202_1446 [Agrilactobacillus composti DSM 18527 = JCM 14202]